MPTIVNMVEKGISHCHRGDVFQIVLSRRFRQGFTGDEFNVYRALRNVNPSPYLFFYDYGYYKLMGSSPESQLIISNGKAVVIQLPVPLNARVMMKRINWQPKAFAGCQRKCRTCYAG